MFIDFFYELRQRKVPVSTQEWMTLMEALALGLHDSSLTGFYELARAVCVKQVAHYDAFDAAFLAVFKGITADALSMSEEMLQWLADPKKRRLLSEEELKALQALSPEELRELFEKRLAEQKERHDLGNRWIGTGGTSPFGANGTHPTGMVLGEGGSRSAMQVAGQRRYREYRNDLILDVRQIDLALRLLRTLGREGAEAELDLEETINETARNAGDLEIVMRPPERNRTKVVLLMDVGGSMDPHAELVNRLFTAASRAGRFARFRSYYFHNCIYEAVFEDAGFRKPLTLADLMGTSDRDEKLVLVGDASMHPAELLQAGGSIYYSSRTRRSGLEWMRLLAEHYRKSIWLNPEPESYWGQPTIRLIGNLFHMFPLTIDGLERGVRCLLRGDPKPPGVDAA
jgi:uncharacterized protein with von Willebrand factor type A (vWA) domain